jgi:hypothetical protein
MVVDLIDIREKSKNICIEKWNFLFCSGLFI